MVFWASIWRKCLLREKTSERVFHPRGDGDPSVPNIMARQPPPPCDLARTACHLVSQLQSLTSSFSKYSYFIFVFDLVAAVGSATLRQRDGVATRLMVLDSRAIVKWCSSLSRNPPDMEIYHFGLVSSHSFLVMGPTLMAPRWIWFCWMS